MRELLDVMAELEERWVLRRLSDIDLSVVPPLARGGSLNG